MSKRFKGARFKVGDVVMVTNDYGVVTGPKTVTRVIEKWHGCSGDSEWDHNAYRTRGPKYMVSPSDSPWFAVIGSHLSLVSEGAK